MTILGAAFKRDWIDRYFQLQREIYDYFDFDPDPRAHILCDLTQKYWNIKDGYIYVGDKPGLKGDMFRYDEGFRLDPEGHQSVFPGQDFTLVATVDGDDSAIVDLVILNNDNKVDRLW
jgi:hypothetical protein